MADAATALDAFTGAGAAPAAAPPEYRGPLAGAAAGIDLFTGRGEWADPAVPADARARSLAAAHAAAGGTGEEFQKQAAHYLPDADQKRLYQDFGLEAARQKFAGREESAAGYAERKALPGWSSGRGIGWQMRVNKAKAAFDRREASPGDLDTIAQDEWEKQKDERYQKREGFGAAALDTAAGIVPVAGEMALGVGGAALKAGVAAAARGSAPAFIGRAGVAGLTLPATVPGLGMVQGAVRRAGERGEEKPSGVDLLQSYGETSLKAAVLGSFQHYGRGVQNPLARAPLQGAAGVAEAAAADLIAGSVGLSPSKGEVWQDIVKGKYEDAGRQAALQWVAFSAFAALHPAEKPGGPLGRPTKEQVVEQAKRMEGEGYTATPDGKVVPPETPLTSANGPPETPPPGSVREQVEATLRPESPEPTAGQPVAENRPESQVATVATSTPEPAPAVPADPRQRIDHFTTLRDASDRRVQAAETGFRVAKERASMLNAPAEAGDALRAARAELVTARKERKDIQGGLDAARDEVMKQPAGRERFPSQSELDAAALTKQGFTPAQIDALKARGLFHPPDVVTGYDLGTHRVATVERAKEHAARTGEPAVYAEVDIQNLGGLNAHFGANARANPTVRMMTDAVREELGKLGGDAHFFRHGGDEVSAVVVGADRAAVDAALARARERVGENIRAAGLDKIPHPKHPGNDARRGAGIAYGTSEIRKDRPAGDIFDEADNRIAVSRKETPDVGGAAAKAAGAEPPGGQAGGVAEGTRPAGGGVRPAGAGGEEAAPAEETPAGPAGDRGPPAAESPRTLIDKLKAAQAKKPPAPAKPPVVPKGTNPFEVPEGGPEESGRHPRPGTSFESAVREQIDASTSLSPPEAKALRDYLTTGSTRGAAAGGGFSHETVRKRANAAVAKLAGEFPADFGGYESAEQLRAAVAADNARAAHEAAEGTAGGELHPDDVKQLAKAEGAPKAAPAEPTAAERAEKEKVDAAFKTWAKDDPAAAKEFAHAMTRAEREEKAALDALYGKPSADLPAGMGAASVPGQGAAADAPAGRSVWRTVRDFWDVWRELGGATAPRTSRLSPEAGDRVARLGAVEEHAARITPVLAENVLGPVREAAMREAAESGIEFQEARYERLAKKLMATAYEERLRHTRDVLAGEPEADAVKSMIGRENSELNSEADYRESVNSAEYKAFKARWQEHVAPLMDRFFRAAEGLGADAPIESLTQLPDMKFNAKAVRAADAEADRPSVAWDRRGALTNPKLHKFGFAKRFTGSAEGYDIDPRAVIENSIATAAKLAAKADLYRAYEKTGIGKWVGPGVQPPVTADGRTWRKLPDVNPPKGTQAAGAGERHFLLHPDAYKEAVRVMDLADPWGRLPTTQTITSTTLMAPVEGLTHSKNLATFSFKPGVNPVDTARFVVGWMRGNKEIVRRVAELAEMGATKPAGMESAPDAGRVAVTKNPLSWLGKAREGMGRALDTIDVAMRLTADRAFDRLAKAGRVEATEGNRRDYVNQLGLYLRKNQAELVRRVKELGVSPFAVAAANYTVQGVRALTFNPGVKATSARAAAGLRAEMFMRMAAVASLAPLLNYLNWGRADGDDKTPFGSVKVRDVKGKTGSFDLLALTGWPRGARAVGLLALIEGMRAKTPGDDIAQRGIKDFVHAGAHVVEGPPVALAKGALLGENGIGMPVGAKAKPGFPNYNSQTLANIQGAMLNVNPLAASVTGADRPRQKEILPEEKAMRNLGPFGLRYRSTPPGKPQPRH